MSLDNRETNPSRSRSPTTDLSCASESIAVEVAQGGLELCRRQRCHLSRTGTRMLRRPHRRAPPLGADRRPNLAGKLRPPRRAGELRPGRILACEAGCSTNRKPARPPLHAKGRSSARPVRRRSWPPDPPADGQLLAAAARPSRRRAGAPAAAPAPAGELQSTTSRPRR
jgi:hypothetical protein